MDMFWELHCTFSYWAVKHAAVASNKTHAGKYQLRLFHTFRRNRLYNCSSVCLKSPSINFSFKKKPSQHFFLLHQHASVSQTKVHLNNSPQVAHSPAEGIDCAPPHEASWRFSWSGLRVRLYSNLFSSPLSRPYEEECFMFMRSEQMEMLEMM